MKNLVLTLLFLSACQNAPKELPEQKTQTHNQVYVCPPCGGHCDEQSYAKPGTCEHCNMPLVIKSKDINDIPNKTICFYLQDNVELLDFAGPMEVFTVAGYQVFTVSKTKDPILSQGTLKITPDFSIEDAPKADIMVFFGGAHAKPSNDKALIDWIKSRIPETKYFMSVCTGAFIMGKAGILDHKTATTYHTQIDALAEALPLTHVLDSVRYVDNGNVISTAGISAGIDGALHLVAKLQGEQSAKQIAFDIEYDKWIPNQGLIIETKP